MANLIYINEDKFRKNHLASRIRFLFHEMTFFFDGSSALRTEGFNIASKIFSDQNIQIYKTALIIKKYFALVFRILILSTAVFVGLCFLGESINFLGRVVFLLSVMTGFLLFAFLFSKDELYNIDNSSKMLFDTQRSKSTIYYKVDGIRVPLKDFDTSYINQKEHLDQKEHLIKKEEDIDGKNLFFLGFPVEIIHRLLEPLKNGTLGDKLKMTQSEYAHFLHNMIYDVHINPFVVPKGKAGYFRTYFYYIYALLDEIRFKYPDSCWNKKVFFDRLKKAVVNYKNLDETSLRVDDNKPNFSKKTNEYLRSLILSK